MAWGGWRTSPIWIYQRIECLDISPSYLTNIYCRTDISGLSSLLQLEFLDLSTNSLRSLQSLHPLEGLPSLRRLIVANNPFSNSNPHYPTDVSRALPQIAEIDAQKSSFATTDSSPVPPSPDDKSRSETQTEKYLRHYIRGLENQVTGYQKMFTDKELLISGLLKEGNEENECAYAVLTLWREQCHREMMGRLLSEERESIAEKRAATERYKWSNCFFEKMISWTDEMLKKRFNISPPL
jgi:hypothetical protein